jgi:LuxR family transcriptional regulator, positive regulator of biofilm formation
MSKNQKNIASANGNASCYIVGPMKLQNELMAAYLKQETGNECVAVDDISQVRKNGLNAKGRQRLLFLDCQGKSLKVLLAELSPYINKNVFDNRIVLFNVPTDVKFQKEFILKGIHGFFYERDPLDNFIKGVLAVLDGQLWLSREMMTKCIFEGTDNDQSSKNNSDVLTERQIEILAMIAVGSTNDEISDKLCISPHTVKTHLYNIFKKINVPNRIQAALWAAKNL